MATLAGFVAGLGSAGCMVEPDGQLSGELSNSDLTSQQLACTVVDMTPTQWTRNADGSYEREGWVIRRYQVTYRQSRPFERQAVKSHSGWSVLKPNGSVHSQTSTLHNAKLNADRAIAREANA